MMQFMGILIVSNREIRDGALISLEHKTPSGNCILHVAAKSGQAQIMERVLDSLYPNSPLYATNCKGNTALHIAASLGTLGMSQLLIARALDQEAEVKRLLLKAQNVEQNTALHLAVKHGHYDIVDLLIRNEPGLTSITNKAGESPLFLAVDRGFFEIARRILQTQECSDGGRNNMNVLHAAVIRAEISEYLQDFNYVSWTYTFSFPLEYSHTYTHTHTDIYIYIYIHLTLIITHISTCKLM